MKDPHRTMTPEEVAEWEAQIKGLPVAHRIDSVRVARQRAYTVEELWEKWAIFSSRYPTRDGAEFLVWLEI